MKIVNKILQSPILWCILLVLSIVVFTKTIIGLQKENQRLSTNQKVMLQELQSIQLSNGKIAQETGLMTLKLSELQSIYPKVIEEMKAIGIAKRKLVQFAETATQSKLEIETELRDSVSKGLLAQQSTSSSYSPFKVFNYHDNYYSVEGRSFLNKQWLSISNRDTLVQVVYRQRKNKWLWILSPFIYRQRIQCKNPNASIYYAQIIQIKR